MRYRFSTLFIIFFTLFNVQMYSQTAAILQQQIDSLLAAPALRPFNGDIYIVQNKKTLCKKTVSRAETPLRGKRHGYIIGSLSKQITAVLVMRAYEKGLLQLHEPISRYLPKTKIKWADSVTVHQLLNHTAGVTGFDTPLAFAPGSNSLYSNTAFAVLGQIAAAVEGKPYATLVGDLFRFCKMKNSVFPSSTNTTHLQKGYQRQSGGSLQAISSVFNDTYTPAAGLVSTPDDLARWNTALHGGKLLHDSTYIRMITPSATRKHPIFGTVPYGYALQMSDAPREIGHGGYDDGFVSVNFYYPETKTSLIILENIDWKADDIKDTFCFETEIRRILRQYLK